MPGDLKACFQQYFPKPLSLVTRQQMINVITALKASDDHKTDCGRRVISMYDSQMSF